jgi:hypothetical protein
MSWMGALYRGRSRRFSHDVRGGRALCQDHTRVRYPLAFTVNAWEPEDRSFHKRCSKCLSLSRQEAGGGA